MKKLILLSCFILSFSCFSAHSSGCSLTSEDIQQNLGLSWKEFDQTLGEGHRKWAERGCLLEAAMLIDIYTLHHIKTLQPNEVRVLYFHAGQTYAYIPAYDIAVARMLNSTNPDEVKRPELNWNDYVNATIAFLKNDYKKLVRYKKRLSKGKSTAGNKMNLNVVSYLLRCFGKPYSWAYERPNEC